MGTFYYVRLCLSVIAAALSISGAVIYCRSHGRSGGCAMRLGQILGALNLVLLSAGAV